MLIIKIIFGVLIIDFLWSLVSLLCAIPVGKTFITPRFPVLISAIIIFFKKLNKKNLNYCEKCNRNLSINEMKMKCSYCATVDELKKFNLYGGLYYKCSNPKCKETKVITPFNRARTRFSRLAPFSKKMSSRRTLICNYCQSAVSQSNVFENFSLYAADMPLAMAFRETFFYNAFGEGNKDKNISLLKNSELKSHYTKIEKINRIYCGEKKEMDFLTDHTDTIRVSFNFLSSKISKYFYQFRIAIPNDKEHNLKSSEGTIILLDGQYTNTEMRSLIEKFLIDISSINTNKGKFENSVLIGISANGVAELEEHINNGISDPQEMESICKDFLVSKNAENIIHLLNENIENFHFFIYRTGNKREESENKIYNVIPPVQSLLFSRQPIIKKYWDTNQNGIFISVKGKFM